MRIGDIAIARSGDKGNVVNISVIAREKRYFPIIERVVTGEMVKEYFSGMVKGEVEVFVLPHLCAINVVLHQALDGGVTGSIRLDKHGKTMSGYLLNMEFGLDYELKHYVVLTSTNDIAKEMAENEASEGTVVWADRQTEGRGRKGDPWESHDGGLYFSIILRPEVKPEKTIVLPLLTGMAVHRAMKKLGVECRIKLPNDVMVNGKKLCGILCENSIIDNMVRYVVVGVGVNINNPVPPSGISLKEIIGKEFSIKEILNLILLEFELEYMEFLAMDYLFG